LSPCILFTTCSIGYRYLVEKKLEQEKEQRRILEEAERTGILDPDCPPGHILLPTEKRLEQLEFLKRSKFVKLTVLVFLLIVIF
jgi:hypothetical protein